MEINGQCLTDFWEWYFQPEQQETYKTTSLVKYSSKDAVKIRFLALSFAERFGVYEDFFDQAGIHITVSAYPEDDSADMIYEWSIAAYLNARESDKDFESRGEARFDVIDVANDIYNKTIKK
jgi:hypothetical protein